MVQLYQKLPAWLGRGSIIAALSCSLISTLAPSTLAATQVLLEVEAAQFLIPIDELETFVETGTWPQALQPPGVLALIQEHETFLRDKLDDTIELDPEEIDEFTLADLKAKDRKLLKELIPNLNDTLLRETATAIDRDGRGQKVIDFLRGFPQDTITSPHFFDTLVAAATTQSTEADPAKAAIQRFRVSQESAPNANDFETSVLGFIDAFSTAGPLAAFYNYGGAARASFNGPLALNANTSHLFLVDGSDGLGLFSIHDVPRDKNGGRASMEFQLLGDTASILLQDDPGERYSQDTTGTLFTTQHQWKKCCTDGVGIGSLDGEWTMFVEFTNQPKNIQDWLVYSSTPQPHIALDLTPELRVRLDVVIEEELSEELSFDPLQPVPEPASGFGLLALGAFGIALHKNKRGNSQRST